MFQNKRKLQLLATLTTLFLLAFGVGCKGFFVPATLASITVDPPTPTVTQGATQQMFATGTDEDNNPLGTLKSGTSCTGTIVCWSSSDDTIASISANGLVLGVAPGTATITASSGSVSGSTTLTVSLGNVTAITITPSTATITAAQTQTFNVFATISGQTQPTDITNGVAAWTITQNGTDESQYFTLTYSPGVGEVVSVSTTPPTLPFTVTITPSYVSGSTTFVPQLPASLTID
jgi:trimeric autotransporter adhesin